MFYTPDGTLRTKDRIRYFIENMWVFKTSLQHQTLSFWAFSLYIVLPKVTLFLGHRWRQFWHMCFSITYCRLWVRGRRKEHKYKIKNKSWYQHYRKKIPLFYIYGIFMTHQCNQFLSLGSQFKNICRTRKTISSNGKVAQDCLPNITLLVSKQFLVFQGICEIWSFHSEYCREFMSSGMWLCAQGQPETRVCPGQAINLAPLQTNIL